MSFLSRFSWALPALGPSLLYGPLAVLLAGVAVTGGWSLHGGVPSVQSGAAVPCGLLAVVFFGLVASEWRQAWAARRYG